MHRSGSFTAGIHCVWGLAAVVLAELAPCQGAAAAGVISQDSVSHLQAVRTTPAPPSVVDIPTEELVHRLPELKKLKPAASQEQLASILKRVGENVAILFSSFPNVTCREEVTEQRMGVTGAMHDQVYQEFRYLALASPDKKNVGFREYRTDSKGRPLQRQGLDSGYLITEGFVSLPLYFHPSYQPESKFRYLGKEVIGKQATEVVVFAQTSSTHQKERFTIGGESVSVLTQGVAWIDAANNQIVRMRTDLRAPEPEIRLDSQTTRIKFAEIRFKGRSPGLWLPREVEVETRCYGEMFRNTHSYSEFKLFTVQTQMKHDAPPSR
jgi:hypothetical protein